MAKKAAKDKPVIKKRPATTLRAAPRRMAPTIVELEAVPTVEVEVPQEPEPEPPENPPRVYRFHPVEPIPARQEEPAKPRPWWRRFLGLA